MTSTTHPITNTNPSTRRSRAQALTIHIGTFADGQRAVPLTATYSAALGSFGGAER